jgi:hypothetical protein
MKKLCIVRADGGVTILSPKEGKNPIPAEAVAKWSESADPSWLPVQSYHEIDELPARDEFRNAWESDGSRIGINMEKARDLHMARIRRVRNAELARLDIEQLRGRDVAAEKQTLRDLPDNLDLSTASTPEALKAIWPSELPK